MIEGLWIQGNCLAFSESRFSGNQIFIPVKLESKVNLNDGKVFYDQKGAGFGDYFGIVELW